MNWHAVTSPLCSFKSKIFSPLFVSKILAVLSKEPVNALSPSELKDYSSSSTIESPSTLIKSPSTLIETSSILKPFPSTVIIESISSISSSPTSPGSTILLSKDSLLHTNEIEIEIESSTVQSSLVLTEHIASSEINGNIMFSIEGNVLKGKTDKNKEEIMKMDLA